MSSGSSEIVESVIEASNLYDVLGVAQTELEVDSDIVRKKFKQMALQVHPDKCQDERSEIAFKKLHRAYTVLSDPSLRDIYDKYGDSIDGQGSIIEQAKSMFPGMKLEVAIEIAGLILGGHSGKGNTSMTIEEIRDVLEKARVRYMIVTLSRRNLGPFRVSRTRLSGGDDVKPRWTLPSKDYLKYTYQPSIPDKHFFGAHWNYAPATMWLRHYRPLMEEIMSSGWKTGSEWVNCLVRPIKRMSEDHLPGIGHKIIGLLAMWAAFSYVARNTYGERMEAWALLDKIHSFAQGNKLAKGGFWDTEEMDKEKRTQAATETCDRMEKLWTAALEEASAARSFDVLCDKLRVDENNLPLTDIPQPVSWRFGMIPYDNIDAHTFPDGDRKDIAVEVKAHEDHEEHHEEHQAGYVKLTPQRAKEIYSSAFSATAAAHH